MMRLLSLFVLAALLVGCGPQVPQKRKADTGSGSPTTNRKESSGPKYNWTRMLSRVKNVDGRKEKALDLMREAVKVYDDFKRGGKTDKSLLAKAKSLKVRAGDIYDELYEDVLSAAPNETVGEKLWSMRFRTFQSSYDRNAKKVRRIEFM